MDLPKFEMPKFEMPKFELPKFDLATFDLPKFDVPQIDLSEIDLPTPEQVAGFVRDAAYVGIGLAVLTVERLQALQAQLVEVFSTQVTKARQVA